MVWWEVLTPLTSGAIVFVFGWLILSVRELKREVGEMQKEVSYLHGRVNHND